MKISLKISMTLTLLLLIISCELIIKTGTISGNVKDDNSNVSSAFVILLDEGEMLSGNVPLSGGSITNNNGNYTIYLVKPDKNYYVVAVKDNDGDIRYTPGTDTIGYYGTYNVGVWIPSSVLISPGEDRTGINISEMYIIP